MADEEDAEASGFLGTLSEELSRVREQSNYANNSDAFVRWAVRQISPTLLEKEIASACALKGPGDKGIDAAWFDSNAKDKPSGIKGIFYVAQGKCPDELVSVEVFGPQAAKDLQAALMWLKSASGREERPELSGVRAQFEELVLGGTYPCKMAVMIAGEPSDALRQLVVDYNRELRDQSLSNISFEIYDLNRLYELYVDRIEQGDLPVPEEVTFSILENYSSKRTGVAAALVAEVPLLEIYQLYSKYHLALFAKNLRVPLVGSGFNKGIEETLDDEAERGRFWYYNNGLTATCEDYEVKARDTDPDGMTSVRASQIQIVNGCQTCASIFTVGRRWNKLKLPLDPLKDITVLLRLIKVGPTKQEDPAFPHKVARFTNSQTPITYRDLHSTDPEQGRLKERLAADWKYFFEVKRNEWRRRTDRDPSFRTRFDEPFCISNEEAGQAFVAFWNGEPVFAKASKKQLFADEKRYDSIFGFQVPPEALILPWQFRYLMDQWRKKRGFRLRRQGSRRGPALTRAEVLKYGDLYLLAVIGQSLKATWDAKQPKEVDAFTLQTCCQNLKEVIPSYWAPMRGRMQHLVKELDVTFDESLATLYQYAKRECAKDPELGLRNLLIRPSTWKELDKDYGDAIRKVTRSLSPRLESPP